MSTQTGKSFMKGKRRFREFLCDCGNFYYVRTDTRTKDTCGCIHANTKHGMSNTPTWISWSCMLSRCLNPNNPDAEYYSERGITVCERWLVFDNFLADMGIRPKGKTLDRKDNNLGYCKANCRWATPTQQSRNRSCTTAVTVGAVTKPLTTWCDELKIVSANTAHKRIQNGWPASKAVTTPLQRGVQ